MSASSKATNAKSGASRYIKDQLLYRAHLLPGESHDVLLVFMKDDGETLIPAQELAARVLAMVGDPIRADFGLILKALMSARVTAVKSSDNYIGSFVAHIEIDQQGEKTVQWTAKERVYNTMAYKNGYEFFMEGGASEYKAWVYWR